MGKNSTQNWIFFCGAWNVIIFIFSLYIFFSAQLGAPCVPPIGLTHAQPFSRQKQWWESRAGPEVGGQRCIWQSCTENKERERKWIFLGRFEPTAAQKAITPSASNYGCDSDKPATRNYTSRKTCQKIFCTMDDIFKYDAFRDLTLLSLSEKPDTWRINRDYIDRPWFHNNSLCMCPINIFLSSVSHAFVFYHNNSLLRPHSHNRKREEKK